MGRTASMAPQMLAGMWRKTAGAMRPWISFHTSLTLVVAHTMGRQYPSCAQSPFLQRGWTRLAHSGRRSVVPVTMSHWRASGRTLTGGSICWYALAGILSTPGTNPFFRQSRGLRSSRILKSVCSIACSCSRLKTLGTFSRMLRVLQDAADVPQGLVLRVISCVSFALLGCGCHVVGMPFLELVRAGGEETSDVGIVCLSPWCAGVL